jgi:hypothetical protein
MKVTGVFDLLDLLDIIPMMLKVVEELLQKDRPFSQTRRHLLKQFEILHFFRQQPEHR